MLQGQLDWFWNCNYKYLSTHFSPFRRTRRLTRASSSKRNVITESRKIVDEEPSYKFDSNQELFICDVCGAEFQTEPEAKKHVDIHKVVIQCPVCPLTFGTHSDLGLHSASHDPEGKIKCPFCPYVTANTGTYSFKAHLNYVHLKQFPFYCKECGKGFKHSKPFEEHRNLHQGKKPYVCVVCLKGFVYQKYLHVHQVRNHQVRTCLSIFF